MFLVLPVLCSTQQRDRSVMLFWCCPLQVAQRILEIEALHPDSKEGQANAALAQWRDHRGADADVDALIVALRRCNLHAIISDVERVTQEFTA